MKKKKKLPWILVHFMRSGLLAFFLMWIRSQTFSECLSVMEIDIKVGAFSVLFVHIVVSWRPIKSLQLSEKCLREIQLFIYFSFFLRKLIICENLDPDSGLSVSVLCFRYWMRVLIRSLVGIDWGDDVYPGWKLVSSKPVFGILTLWCGSGSSALSPFISDFKDANKKKIFFHIPVTYPDTLSLA